MTALPVFAEIPTSADRGKIKPVRVSVSEDRMIEELLQRNAQRFGGKKPNFSQFIRRLLAEEAKKEGLIKEEEKGGRLNGR